MTWLMIVIGVFGVSALPVKSIDDCQRTMANLEEVMRDNYTRMFCASSDGLVVSAGATAPPSVSKDPGE